MVLGGEGGFGEFDVVLFTSVTLSVCAKRWDRGHSMRGMTDIRFTLHYLIMLHPPALLSVSHPRPSIEPWYISFGQEVDSGLNPIP